MSDVEREESKKTVVAFITGLLIGGLLVWVFSSNGAVVAPTETPEEGTVETTEEVATENTTETASDAVVSTGSLTVIDQSAGKMVTLGALSFPAESGWVVVRDYMDGVPGNILGAARYNTKEGLTPTTVELMRDTVKGSSYQVVYYTNEGAPEFSTTDDKPVVGVQATFKAN